MVSEVLKTVPVARVTTLAEQVDASIVPERLIATLSGLFGALGSVLTAVGIYGLLAYTVARRINEIGIRMALGATRSDVIRMVLGDALGMVCAGLAIGAPIAYFGQTIRGESDPGLAGQQRHADCLRRGGDDCGRAACGICAGSPGGQRGPNGSFATRVSSRPTSPAAIAKIPP